MSKTFWLGLMDSAMRGFTMKNFRLLLVIVASSISLGGCGPSEIEIAREKERLISELQQDQVNRMLAPSWYRRSLSYGTAYPVTFINRFAYSYSSIKWALAFTAVVSTILYIWVFGFKLNTKDDEVDYSIAPILVIPVCELLAILIYPIVYIFVFIIFGNYYIPTGLIGCFLYAAVIVVPPVLYISPKERIRSDIQAAVIHGTVSAGRPKKGRIITVAVRAFAVAIITSVGSQLGGWLGGIAAIVLSSVLASVIGFDIHSHSDQHGGHGA